MNRSVRKIVGIVASVVVAYGVGVGGAMLLLEFGWLNLWTLFGWTFLVAAVLACITLRKQIAELWHES